MHGITFIEVTTGPRPVRIPRTAVIGLVGTAPLLAVDADNRKVNELVAISSSRQAEQYFGPAAAGYTIPQALSAIFDQGAGLVVVVNVFDPAVHKTAVALADHDLNADTDEVVLTDALIEDVVVKNAAGDVTHVAGTDYSVTTDETGSVVKRISTGAIANGATIKIGYNKSDPSLVDADDIVGDDDPRTGIALLEETVATFGYKPKLLIAPGFSDDTDVVTALQTMAAKCRALALIDAPANTSVAAAIAGRTAPGDLNFFTGDERTVCLYPGVVRDDVTYPLSPIVAGIQAAVDDAKGYWYSPSNNEIRGIDRAERALVGGISDPNSEVQQLNDVGIVTINTIAGIPGYRLWGNRTAAYPGSSDPLTFIVCRRVEDLLKDSLEVSWLEFLDLPINNALIDAMLQSGNAFIANEIRKGALAEGSQILFDEGANPAEEIAAGHLTFELDIAVATPAETIRIRASFNINLLALKAAA